MSPKITPLQISYNNILVYLNARTCVIFFALEQLFFLLYIVSQFFTVLVPFSGSSTEDGQVKLK